MDKVDAANDVPQAPPVFRDSLLFQNGALSVITTYRIPWRPGSLRDTKNPPRALALASAFVLEVNEPWNI
jgi:hypothetical protein